MSEENFNDDVGLQAVGFVDDLYVMSLDIEPRHRNMGGYVHGGVLATMLDTAMARAYWMAGDGDKQTAVTLEMKVNYIHAVKIGKLSVHAKLVNATRRTAYVEAYVVNEEERLIAKATATLMVL